MCGFYFTLQKCSCSRKYFSENFDILYAYMIFYFHFSFMISMNSNSFHHKTLERRWHDFFHLCKWQGVSKIIEFHVRIFPILKLYATQWFSREKIKWLLQIMKYELGVSKDQFQVLLDLIFQIGFIWVLFKLFFSKNKIYRK